MKKTTFALSFGITFLLLGLALIPFTMPLPEPTPKPQYSYIHLGTWTGWNEMPFAQGVFDVEVFENTTGSWVSVAVIYNYTNENIEFPVGSAVKIESEFTANKTLLGFNLSPDADMWNYIRMNVSITQRNNTVVYSQGNMSMTAGAPQSRGANIYSGSVNTVCNFLTEYGEVYSITLMYDTYW